jgi:hypothetical protein
MWCQQLRVWCQQCCVRNFFRQLECRCLCLQSKVKNITAVIEDGRYGVIDECVVRGIIYCRSVGAGVIDVLMKDEGRKEGRIPGVNDLRYGRASGVLQNGDKNHIFHFNLHSAENILPVPSAADPAAADAVPAAADETRILK